MSEQPNTTQLDDETLKKIAEKGKKSLFFFTRAILGFDKVTKSIHRPICKALEDLEGGSRRMLLMLPRDWYKTTIASISYPIWRAVNNPEIRILLVQNTYTNACSKLAAVKQIFEKNELFKACYPEILPRKDNTWAKDSLCVNRKGSFPESTFEAAGTNTSVVSRHYDLIIEDDTVAPDFDNMTGAMMQPTRAQVEKAIGWHRLAHPLLIEPSESQILVVGTRWVEDDLLEWIMKNEPMYKVIQRAVREDENGNPSKTGKLTWEMTDDGKPKFTDAVLKQLEHALGPYMFSTLYLNLPTAAGNMLFKPEWILYHSNPAATNMMVFTSVDLASAKAESSSDPDYTVVMTCGLYPSKGLIYVLKYDRGRYNPGETIDIIFEHYRTYTFLSLILESIGYQRTLSYWLNQRMQKTGVFFPVNEITSYTQSKDARIRGLQPYFAASKIFITNDMPELENELIHFPYGKHDDLLDALSAQIPTWAESIDVNVTHAPRQLNTLEQVTASYLIQMIKDHQKGPVRNPLADLGLFAYGEDRKGKFLESRPFSKSRFN